MSLQACINELVEELRAMGIRYAPDLPPSQIGSTPAGIVYATAGRDNSAPADVRTSHQDIAISILMPFKDLARNYEMTVEWRDSVPNRIFAARKAGRITAGKEFTRIDFSIGSVMWGATEYFGVTFTLRDVKYQTVITDE